MLPFDDDICAVTGEFAVASEHVNRLSDVDVASGGLHSNTTLKIEVMPMKDVQAKPESESKRTNCAAKIEKMKTNMDTWATASASCCDIAPDKGRFKWFIVINDFGGCLACKQFNSHRYKGNSQLQPSKWARFSVVASRLLDVMQHAKGSVHNKAVEFHFFGKSQGLPQWLQPSSSEAVIVQRNTLPQCKRSNSK